MEAHSADNVERCLQIMRQLNHEFLSNNEGSDEVRDYMAKVINDDEVLKRFLRGRKYRPEHAWKTLKRKAEVCLEYPEVFRNVNPKFSIDMAERGIYGILKNRDQHGRRLLCLNGTEWDTKKYSLEDFTVSGAHLAFEILMKDEDATTNGVVYVQNCAGLGMNHAKQYSLPAMLKLLHVFWYACPLMFKAVYFVNVPPYLTFVYHLIRPFFSQKLKERLIVSTTNKKFEILHEDVRPEFLPNFLGGHVENLEAFETDLLKQSQISNV